MNFHDPWVGTDTPGYGEAVFTGQDLQKQAGKPKLKKNKVFEIRRKKNIFKKNPYLNIQNKFKKKLGAANQ